MKTKPRKPKCRSMRIEAGGMSTLIENQREHLVIEQYTYGGAEKRVTIDLGHSGAEELAVKLSLFLKARRERMQSLERHIASAVEESKR